MILILALSWSLGFWILTYAGIVLDRCVVFVFLIDLFQGLVSGQEQVSQPPPPARPRRDERQAPRELHDDDDRFFSDDGEAGQGGGSGDAGQGGARAKVKAAPSRTASTLPSKTASTKSASTVKTAARHARTHARTASVRGIFLSFPDLIQSNLFPNLTSYSLLFSPTFKSRSMLFSFIDRLNLLNLLFQIWPMSRSPTSLFLPLGTRLSALSSSCGLIQSVLAPTPGKVLVVCWFLVVSHL